jgi:prevent-host-death family protein
MNIRRISTSDLRIFLTTIIDEVRVGKDVVIVKYFGEEAVAIVPVEEYTRLSGEKNEKIQ